MTRLRVALSSVRSGCIRIGFAAALGALAVGGCMSGRGLIAVQASALEVAAAPAESLGVMPSVEGETLAGERVRLPQDLAPQAGGAGVGRTAVLIVGFGREASGAARDWGQRLAADAASLPDTTYFEMPVVAGVPRLLRGSVLRLMSGSVSERGRHHFLPITEQEAAWRALVGFQDAAVPYILVVDDRGAVRWRASGAFSAPLYAELRKHLPPGPR